VTPELLAQLAEAFPEEFIGKKPAVWCLLCELRECIEHEKRPCTVCGDTLTVAHDHLDYVGHAYVRERLNRVDPNWNWAPLAFDTRGLPVLDENRGMWISLTIGGKAMFGYGAPDRSARGGNAVKEVIGDAIRNAAQSFGVALDLWKHEKRTRQVVEASSDDQGAEERAANRMREAIKTLGHKKKRKFLAVLQMFDTWANGNATWADADLATLTAFQDHLAKA